MHFFVTGTNTNVGKTHFTSLWVRRARKKGLAAAGLKPICAGDREDAARLREAAENALTLDEINPCAIDLPLAPWAAAARLGKDSLIDFGKVNGAVAAARKRFTHLAVEGVAGWMVPLARGITVRDWAKELGLPVLVVAYGGLGTLSSVLLTLENIERSGLKPLGVVLNHYGSPPDFAAETNRAVLADWTGLPVIEIVENGDLPEAGMEWLAV